MSKADTGIEKETISFYSESSFTQGKTLEVKYAISGSTFKTQLPIFQDGNAEEFLHFLYEFEQTKNKLGYTTGPKLESGIEQLLKGTARNEWNTIKNNVDPNVHTVTSFNNRIEAFRRTYIPEPSAVENQKM